MDVFLADVLALPEVLGVVLGRSLPRDALRPASMSGVSLIACQPGDQIALCDDPGGHVEGWVITLSEPQDRALLDFYNEAFARQAETRSCNLLAPLDPDGAPLQAAVATDQPVRTYLVERAGMNTALLPLDAQQAFQWRAQWGAVGARMSEELMAYFGRKPAAEMTRSLFSMRLRASAYLAAVARPAPPGQDLARDVVVHDHRREYVNFFGLEEVDLQYRRFDGTLSPVLNRGVFMVGEAVAVLPYDPLRDQVLLIEQFRAAIYIAGAQAPWTLEPPAGLVDPGETPPEAARREAMEEAGVTLAALEPVGRLYSSSGSSSEFVHVFVGVTDLGHVAGGGGVPGEGEDIRSKVMSFQELIQDVDDCVFVDMPLVTAALWLARHRDRLRAQHGG